MGKRIILLCHQPNWLKEEAYVLVFMRAWKAELSQTVRFGVCLTIPVVEWDGSGFQNKTPTRNQGMEKERERKGEVS